MSAAKWIFGGLGFVLGGPIGALIGILIGQAYEQPKALPNGNNNYERKDGNVWETNNSKGTRTERKTRQTVSPNDIRIALLVLIACVMKADGHVKKNELDLVKQFLVRNYGEQGAVEALKLLKGLLDQDINHISVSEQIADNLNYSTRFELLHFLLELAHADGIYDEKEESLILNISLHLGLSNADYRSLVALYKKNVDPNWAYEALETAPTATDEEVKKAYRRVAMKYHPDKVASAGEEIKQKATEKFQQINKAYEYIKQQRGL